MWGPGASCARLLVAPLPCMPGRPLRHRRQLSTLGWAAGGAWLTQRGDALPSASMLQEVPDRLLPMLLAARPRGLLGPRLGPSGCIAGTCRETQTESCPQLSLQCTPCFFAAWPTGTAYGGMRAAGAPETSAPEEACSRAVLQARLPTEVLARVQQRCAPVTARSAGPGLLAG